MLLWLWVLTTMASFRHRHGEELFDRGGMDTQVMFQAVSWCLLGLLAFWLVAAGRADLRLIRRGPLLWYGVFIVAALLSAAVSPVPTLTLFRAGQQGIALLLVISLRDQLPRMYTFILVYVAINWVLLLMAVTGLHFNQEWIYGHVEGKSLMGGDFMQRWRFTTAYGHPSWLSIMAAVGAVGLAARTQGGKWKINGPLIVLLVLTTLLTVSRTAIAGMILGFAVVALGRRQLVTALLLVLLPCSALFVSSDFRRGVSRYLARGQRSQELESLTGRTEIYEVALQRIERSLPIGEGYQSGRFNPLEEDKASMAHAHNLLLEAACGTGILGAFAVLMIVATWLGQIAWLLARTSLRFAQYDPTPWELAAISAPLLAFGLLDSGFVTTVHFVTFLYLIVFARGQMAVMDAVAGQNTTGDAPSQPSAVHVRYARKAAAT
jgi:O-antigen ligase